MLHPKKKAAPRTPDRNLQHHGEPTEIESLPFTRQKLPTSGVADRNGYTKRGHPESRASSKIFT